MPSKNTIKEYVEGGFYHIYNRGVEKRLIFQDREDYTKFLYLLKLYLSPIDVLSKEYPLLKQHIVAHNVHGEAHLLAFCLMPNHFHLLVKQDKKDTITRLMRAVVTSYSMYFNKRYERVGSLFQGIFKASRVGTDEYLLHLSRYIHLNPIERGASLSDFQWSSYLYYLGEKEALWLNTQFIKDYFNESNPNLSYRNFVEEQQTQVELPPNITID